MQLVVCSLYPGTPKPCDVVKAMYTSCNERACLLSFLCATWGCDALFCSRSIGKGILLATRANVIVGASVGEKSLSRNCEAPIRLLRNWPCLYPKPECKGIAPLVRPCGWATLVSASPSAERLDPKSLKVPCNLQRLRAKMEAKQWTREASQTIRSSERRAALSVQQGAAERRRDGILRYHWLTLLHCKLCNSHL